MQGPEQYTPIHTAQFTSSDATDSLSLALPPGFDSNALKAALISVESADIRISSGVSSRSADGGDANVATLSFGHILAAGQSYRIYGAELSCFTYCSAVSGTPAVIHVTYYE